MNVIRPAIVSFVLLTAITGVVYPLVITGVAKAVFPVQADGSLIKKDGTSTTDEKVAVGSILIGQTFDQPQYFWSRPSATSPQAYNASSSSGSNLGPSNSGLTDAIKGRIDTLMQADPGNSSPVPVDLVTASASGLDPQESVAAAEYQISRVAKIRNMDRAKIESLVQAATTPPDLGGLGERVVNVLALNLALDQASPYTPPATTAASQAATGTAPATVK